jgi:hypothetical protein
MTVVFLPQFRICGPVVSGKFHPVYAEKPRPFDLTKESRNVGHDGRAAVLRFDADHRQARFGEDAVKPLRQRSSFQPNSL